MATNFELTITANDVKSTDERFTMDDLELGNNYEPLDVYFKRADGTIIKRIYNRNEKRNSNQTMPRIAFQVFEKQISALSVEDKENFPICKYNPNTELICGIYSSEDEYRRHRNSIEYLTYKYDNDRQFVIYSWNIFIYDYFCAGMLEPFRRTRR